MKMKYSFLEEKYNKKYNKYKLFEYDQFDDYKLTREFIIKFKRLNFIGGQDPLDSTDVQIRAERVLSAILQVFLTSGEGWELDPRHANGEDYFRFKTWNQSGVVQSREYPALFFRNSISGCKMFFWHQPSKLMWYSLSTSTGGSLWGFIVPASLWISYFYYSRRF